MKAKEETIFEQLYRFTASIRDEVRDTKPDKVSIDFWLYKIERRIKVLEKEENETSIK